ncbi:MAG: 4Fe-4S binding protein [Planctomycetota bacterium]|jgi:protein NrfC
MGNQQENKHGDCDKKTARRDFLKLAGVVVISGGAGSCAPSITTRKDGIPVSVGYILVDAKKCQGCLSCMLACSLAHEGETNLSLSRIQIIQNSFEKWPDDVTIEQCRQCVDPTCVKACPTEALKADPKYGNVRTVDAGKCIGCRLCIEACPYTPSGPVAAADKDFKGDVKARKCDLCANARYHWDKEGAGPGKKQACVEVCPVGAIKFTKRVPAQEGDAGYKVNLRGKSWEKLGYPIS